MCCSISRMIIDQNRMKLEFLFFKQHSFNERDQITAIKVAPDWMCTVDNIDFCRHYPKGLLCDKQRRGSDNRKPCSFLSLTRDFY